jgi:hypothetical protein
MTGIGLSIQGALEIGHIGDRVAVAGGCVCRIGLRLGVVPSVSTGVVVVLGVVVVCQTIQISVIGGASPTATTASVVVLACDRSINQATDVVLLLSVE